MTLTLPPPAVELVLMVLVLAAAIYDVRYRRIPNWITASGVVIGLALNSFLYQGVAGLLFALKGFGVGFGLYLLLYAIHAMGAGDVKLMAAVGSLVGWGDWFGIFLVTAILGGIMAIIVSLARGRMMRTVSNIGYIFGEMRQGRPAYLSREELDVKSPKSVGLPHGAVIAVGTLFFLALSAHYGR
jgi:prepilin peptidase CpaA